MKERLYLFLGLFFITIPAFAEPATTAMLIGAGVSALTSIFGGVSAGAAKRQAERRERAAAANRMALEANRVDPPDFGQDFENPAANLQVATQASSMAAEQQDISLASTLDTLRATGASAGGATALARAAAQSKRGVSAQIEQQEARNAQLRAQGELQAASIRQKAETLQYQATTARENQALNRAASLESSASQQAAAYGAQSSQMIGQAVGAVGSFAAQGGFGAQGPFAGQTPVVENKALETLGTQGVKQLESTLSGITPGATYVPPPGFDSSTQNPFAGLNLRFDPAAKARMQQQQMGLDFMGSYGMNYNPYGIPKI